MKSVVVMLVIMASNLDIFSVHSQARICLHVNRHMRLFVTSSAAPAAMREHSGGPGLKLERHGA